MSLIPDVLAEILVCPDCHGDLDQDLERSELVCIRCGLRYRVDDGIPVMLVEEARKESE